MSTHKLGLQSSESQNTLNGKIAKVNYSSEFAWVKFDGQKPERIYDLVEFVSFVTFVVVQIRLLHEEAFKEERLSKVCSQYFNIYIIILVVIHKYQFDIECPKIMKKSVMGPFEQIKIFFHIFLWLRR